MIRIFLFYNEVKKNYTLFFNVIKLVTAFMSQKFQFFFLYLTIIKVATRIYNKMFNKIAAFLLKSSYNLLLIFKLLQINENKLSLIY